MTVREVEKLFERVRRARRETEKHAGDGAAWDYTFPDGETVHYHLANVKDAATVEHDTLSLVGFFGDLKDHLKWLAKATPAGQPVPNIEQVLKGSRPLQICVDLATKKRHGEYTSSHSGEYPVLGEVTYTFIAGFGVVTSVRSLTFGVDSFSADLDPETAGITLPVLNRAGEVIGDAFQLLDAATAEWERTFAQLR